MASSDRTLTPQVTSTCTDITRIYAFAYRSADFTARASHPDLAKREGHLGVVMGWEKRRGMREARRPFLDGGTIMDLEADSRSEGKAGDEGEGDRIS